MDGFKVVLKRSAESFLKRLSRSNPFYEERILELLVFLERYPVPASEYDVRKLKGYENIYRVRIGELRVIYTVDYEKRRVIVLDIGWRGRIY